jgi:hypothetical protein
MVPFVLSIGVCCNGLCRDPCPGCLVFVDVGILALNGCRCGIVVLVVGVVQVVTAIAYISVFGGM